MLDPWDLRPIDTQLFTPPQVGHSIPLTLPAPPQVSQVGMLSFDEVKKADIFHDMD
jgi:hypothetical protein